MEAILKVIGQVGQVEYTMLPLKDVAISLGYTERYTRRLCNDGKLISNKIASRWFAYPKLITSEPLQALLREK